MAEDSGTHLSITNFGTPHPRTEWRYWESPVLASWHLRAAQGTLNGNINFALPNCAEQYLGTHDHGPGESVFRPSRRRMNTLNSLFVNLGALAAQARP